MLAIWPARTCVCDVESRILPHHRLVGVQHVQQPEQVEQHNQLLYKISHSVLLQPIQSTDGNGMVGACCQHTLQIYSPVQGASQTAPVTADDRQVTAALGSVSAHSPVVAGTPALQLQSAQRVCDVLDCITQAMREVIGRVNAPGVTTMWMLPVLDPATQWKVHMQHLSNQLHWQEHHHNLPRTVDWCEVACGGSKMTQQLQAGPQPWQRNL